MPLLHFLMKSYLEMNKAARANKPNVTFSKSRIQ